VDIADVAAWVTVAVAVAGGISGLAGHWLARRQASGRVSTSEASVLWAQSQDMRHQLLEDKRRAEDQRDRLIDSYTAQVLPALTSINFLVQGMGSNLSEVLGILRQDKAAEGEWHEASAAPGT
jgi:hypothetical protein